MMRHIVYLIAALAILIVGFDARADKLPLPEGATEHPQVTAADRAIMADAHTLTKPYLIGKDGATIASVVEFSPKSAPNTICVLVNTYTDAELSCFSKWDH